MDRNYEDLVQAIFSYCLLFFALRGNMLIPKQRRSNSAKKGGNTKWIKSKPKESDNL